MPNRGDRGGAKTRAHISAVATALFLERGFDAVTIAEVAAAAGVSKVTVFSYFDRKEDLLLDRLPDALDIVQTAVRERADDVSPVEALRRAALALADHEHVFSGLSAGAEPFMRIFLESPALVARLRGFEREIEIVLAADLHADVRFAGDSALAAALLVAAYRTVVVESTRRRLDGDDPADIAVSHHQRLSRAFAAVAHGLDLAPSAT